MDDTRQGVKGLQSAYTNEAYTPDSTCETDRDAKISAKHKENSHRVKDNVDHASTNGAPERAADTYKTLENADQIKEHAAPDGGWGWVVCFVCFIELVIFDGIFYTFGLVFTELTDYFQARKERTAWIMSLNFGISLMIGPFISALCQRFGFRVVTVAGCLVTACGLVLSSMAQSVAFLYFSYGILAGFGYGIIYLCTSVAVAQYFDKRRSLATGIAVCGNGVGIFVMSPITETFIRVYTWRGAILLQTGFILNGVVFALLLRPVVQRRNKQDNLKENIGANRMDITKSHLNDTIYTHNTGSNNDRMGRKKDTRSICNPIDGIKEPRYGSSDDKHDIRHNRTDEIKDTILRSTVGTEDTIHSHMDAQRYHTDDKMESCYRNSDGTEGKSDSRTGDIKSTSYRRTDAITNTRECHKEYISNSNRRPKDQIVDRDDNADTGIGCDHDIKDGVNETTHSITVNVAENTNEIKDDTNETTNTITDDTDETTNGITDDTKETTNGIKDGTNDTTNGIKNDTNETTNGIKIDTHETTNGIKVDTNETTNEITDDTNETTYGIKDDTNETTTGITDDTNETTYGIKDDTNETTTGIKDDTNETIKEIKDDPNETTHTSKHEIIETTNPIKEANTSRTDDEIIISSNGHIDVQVNENGSCDRADTRITYTQRKNRSNSTLPCPYTGRLFLDHIWNWLISLWHVLCQIVMETVDVSLLKDRHFFAFTIASAIYSLVYYIPFVYLPDLAKDVGIDEFQRAWLLSAIGIMNTVSRVCYGLIGDRPCVNRLYMYNVCVIVYGVMTIFTPLVTSFHLLMAICIVYGISQGLSVVLTIVLVADIVGVDKHSQGFGLLNFFSGIMTFVGPPLAGWLYDITGTYNITFYTSGVLMSLSGLILFILPCIDCVKRYNNKTK